MIQLVMCLVHWNEESIDFNGCPSLWKGIVGNGANVARVFFDHQGLSTDVDLSVSLKSHNTGETSLRKGLIQNC